MKPVRFVGSAKDDLSAFPKPARLRAGHELFMVQVGRDPDDWKPMTTVGPGACEIRVRDQAGAFRVIYVARFEDAVYVLHAFQKKSRKTSRTDVRLARLRYNDARDLAIGANRG
jgi:phage-related protein